MSRYTAEQKQASLRAARALLASLDARPAYESADEDVANADAVKAARDAANLVYEPKPEDSIAKWKRKSEEWTAKCEAATAARKEQERGLMIEKTQADASWNQWADRKIAAALEAHGFNELQTDALGMTISELRYQLRQEIKEAVGELRGELSAQRAAEKYERGQVLDLPALPWRKKSDVA